VARAARRAGRQAQSFGLLLAVLFAACAKMGDPPGGPPDTAPPAIVAVRPESGAVVPGWKDDAVIQFDEVIDEMAGGRGGAGGGAGVTGLARQVLLSPVTGDVAVGWGRTRIRVKPKEGWKQGRVYRLELLPGIVDLRRNTLKTARVIVFSTGPAIGHATLAGTALQWVEQRPMIGALIEAVPLPDSAGYLTQADSTGRFHFDALGSGRYVVYATLDQNTNRRRDRREAYDSALVTLDSSATVTLFAFVHDTLGPRLRIATAADSLSVRVEFSQALAPSPPLDTTRVHVLQLPDSTPVAIAGILTLQQYDSVTAAERKAAAKPDSTRPDTIARRDTVARPDSAKAVSPRDTTESRRLLAQRPVPFDKVVLRFAQPLKPETRYVIRVRGAVNLNGAMGDGQVVVLTPKPAPPAKADTTSHAPRPTRPSPP
jgi:Big-like domain-containing protein